MVLILSVSLSLCVGSREPAVDGGETAGSFALCTQSHHPLHDLAHMMHNVCNMMYKKALVQYSI